MSKEHEPPEAQKPPQTRENPETPPQRRASENSSQKERQGLMEYSEKDEEKLLKQLEKFVIAGEKDEYFPYRTEITDFKERHGIKNPLPLYRKLLERLTPEQALVLSHGIDEPQDKEYSSKFREKIKIGVNPEAILRHASYTLPCYFSMEEITKIVKRAIFTLQTNDPNGDQVIYKYLGSLGNIISEAELEALAKETLEKIINSGKPEQILETTYENHFSLSDKMDKLILAYTEKAVAILVSQGREEEVFNYARNYQNSFMFERMVTMRKIFGPIIIDVLKNPSEKIYTALLSSPSYYQDLSFMDMTEFEKALYKITLQAAEEREYVEHILKNKDMLYALFGGDQRYTDIMEACETTAPDLFGQFEP